MASSGLVIFNLVSRVWISDLLIINRLVFVVNHVLFEFCNRVDTDMENCVYEDLDGDMNDEEIGIANKYWDAEGSLAFPLCLHSLNTWCDSDLDT